MKAPMKNTAHDFAAALSTLTGMEWSLAREGEDSDSVYLCCIELPQVRLERKWGPRAGHIWFVYVDDTLVNQAFDLCTLLADEELGDFLCGRDACYAPPVRVRRFAHIFLWFRAKLEVTWTTYGDNVWSKPRML